FAVRALHGAAVVDDADGDPGVGVADGFVAARQRASFDRGYGCLDEVGSPQRHLFAFGLVPLTPRLEEALHSADGIALTPLLLFLGRAIQPGVVGGGVRSVPVRHRLDQRRAVSPTGLGHGFPRGQVDGDRIHAVDPYP